MAKNQVYHHPDRLELTVPSGRVSGDPVVVGQIPGVCLNDRQTDGKATVATAGVFTLSVKGEGAAGAAAVAEGDLLYYESGQTPPVNKDATNGVRFGYALEAVASGTTATIKVKVGY